GHPTSEPIRHRRTHGHAPDRRVLVRAGQETWKAVVRAEAGKLAVARFQHGSKRCKGTKRSEGILEHHDACPRQPRLEAVGWLSCHRRGRHVPLLSALRYRLGAKASDGKAIQCHFRASRLPAQNQTRDILFADAELPKRVNKLAQSRSHVALTETRVIGKAPQLRGS